MKKSKTEAYCFLGKILVALALFATVLYLSFTCVVLENAKEAVSYAVQAIYQHGFKVNYVILLTNANIFIIAVVGGLFCAYSYWTATSALPIFKNKAQMQEYAKRCDRALSPEMRAYIMRDIKMNLQPGQTCEELRHEICTFIFNNWNALAYANAESMTEQIDMLEALNCPDKQLGITLAYLLSFFNYTPGAYW